MLVLVSGGGNWVAVDCYVDGGGLVLVGAGGGVP